MAEAGVRIAIVDDEPELRSAVAVYLRGAGFEVVEADGGAALDRAVAERPIDLAILDIRMPGESGLEIARRLRQTCRAGIVMLTGLTDPVDRVVGLELGADDYIAKPFDLRELLARVRAVIRRVRAQTSTPRPIRLGPRRFDPATGALTEGARRIRLTPKEVALLRLLARREGGVVARADILAETEQGAIADIFDRAVDARVVRLRRKIEDDPARPRHLLTVLGHGYRLLID